MNTEDVILIPSEAGLFQVEPETRAWLHDTELDIWGWYTKEEEEEFYWCHEGEFCWQLSTADKNTGQEKLKEMQLRIKKDIGLKVIV